MKKLLSLLLAVLLIPCIAFSDEEDFNPEGEWYYGIIDGSPRLAERTDDAFIVPYGDEDWVFHFNGTIEWSGHTEHYRFIHLSDDAAMFWIVQDHHFYAVFFFNEDGDWKYYKGFELKLMLIVEDRMIPSWKGGKTAAYYVYGNKMYFVQEESYIQGIIQRLGDMAFACVLDTTGYDMDYTPIYVFIRPDIAE